MPELILKKTGKPVYVPDDQIGDAIASGMFEAPDANQRVSVEVRPGLVGDTTVGDLGAHLAGGRAVESDQSFRGREREARLDREHGGVIDTAITGIESALDEATFGGFGAVADSVGGDEYRERRLERQEANPTAATVGKIGGAVGTAVASGGAGVVGKVARATPLGAATRAGARIAKAGEGASTASKVARVAAGGAFEGGAAGFGEGVQQLRNSDDPLTLERAASVLSSNVLFGAGVGSAANLVGKGVEKSLRRAKVALDDVAARGAQSADSAAGGIPEDLAGLDARQLKGARQVELEAIEAARVPRRADLADEIKAFRADMKAQKVWLATKGAEEAELRAIGKRTLKADRHLDSLIDDPKQFAENPRSALATLRRQEAALDELVTKHGDSLRTKFATDASGDRLAALDNAAAALERNRALQQRITDLAAPPSSPRLTSIDDAKDALLTGGRTEKSLPEQLLQGTVFGQVTGAVGAVAGAIPGGAILGPFAPLLGARAAKAVTEGVFGGLARAQDAVAKRMAAAVAAFADVAAKVTPAAPVLATKTLGAVGFGPAAKAKRDSKADKSPALPELYKARSDEIKAQTAYGPDGQPRMRPEARAKMAAQLAGVRAADPVLADRMETAAARRIEYYASKMPRRPDLGALQTGPDRWQPSEFEMRAWARTIAAGEDPGGIAERLAAGTITPEDAEVMRALYPEQLAELTQQILQRLPTLQAQLPYHRRLALSILTGAPVDPAMHPRILRRLQASFKNEAGTAGGTHAPRAQPQFGSVKAHDMTPSQRREQQHEGAGA